MKDTYVEVTFEVSALELAVHKDPSQFVFEKMRDRAGVLCSEAGGRLRTDAAPELVVSRGIDKQTGADMVLCASRWAAVVPDAVTEEPSITNGSRP